MPQWSRNRTADQAKYPDERARAHAPPATRSLLRRYDHHVVRVDRRQALLLTYHWDDDVEQNERLAGDLLLPVEVSFTYPDGHPAAPADVQAIVDSLTFTPVAISTERANECWS
jgi:hypothetical protein